MSFSTFGTGVTCVILGDVTERFLFFLGLTVLVGGCASADPTYETQMFLPDSSANSQAHGAAYSNMMINKPIPSRPNWRPVEFYFKHCNAMDSKSYFSKTEYDCSDP